MFDRFILHTSLFLLLLALVSSCSKNEKKEKPHYPVAIADVIQKDVPIYIESIGNVYSLQTVQVHAQVSGVIIESYVKQGQYVKKGDKLYQIDPRPFQANLEKAKAQLAKDTATLQINEEIVKRNRQVVESNYLAKLTFDQYVSNVAFSKAQVASDEADIEIANLNLEWSSPVSPIDGKISQYNIDPGNLVIAFDPNFFTTIQQITPADIRFTINQKEFVNVQKAMKAGELIFQVILPEDPLKIKEGQIYFIDNHIDLNTGTILVKGTIDNKDEFLWPGEFIKVRLQLKIDHNAILVPIEALKVGPEGPYAFVYDPKTATVEYRKVVQGQTIGDQVIVDKGINPGEKIVTKGQGNLHSGDKVNVIPAAETQTKPIDKDL